MSTQKENRERLIERLSHKALPVAIKEELDHAMDVDREPGDYPNGYDLVDAFEDAYSIAEDNGYRKFLGPADRILIDVGYYKPMTDDDVRNTVTTGRRPYVLKRDGVCYQVVSGMREWIG